LRVFLIAGRAGSGKDEVAGIIKKQMEKTLITSFSKYIKMYAVDILNWNGLEGSKPRTFLQNMGEALRADDENFLINRLIQDLNVYKEYFDNVVISDVRLINEVEMFKDIDIYDVVTIKLVANTSKRNLSSEERNHRTEIELDNYNRFDYIIENKFDNSLEQNIMKILEEVK